MNAVKAWKQRVWQLKTETYALYLAYRDARVPWYAKVLIGFVVAYTFSPIDLIPDFIPILGYLDDLVIAPLGIALAIRLIPQEVMAECRQAAQEAVGQDRPASWPAAVVIVAIWLIVAALAAVVLFRLFQGGA
jgi:uncharacterized membrane protein YkvA (DUF1232 family)